MKKDLSGGTKNQLSPKFHSPKLNKTLLVLNVILCPVALFLCAANLYYKEYGSAACMLGVAIVTAANAVLAWKRLKGKTI